MTYLVIPAKIRLSMIESERGISAVSEQAPKKERLSEEKLGGLLAAIGNHEGKALLLILMRKGRLHGAYQLHALAMNAQGEQKRWRTAKNLQLDWCQKSLYPIGLVALEVIDQEANTLGYMKTDYGDKEGTALAGHLLAFSERHPETSLYKLFGATMSTSKRHVSETEDKSNVIINRSPLTSYRMFYELATSNHSLREVDIEASLKERYPAAYYKESPHSSISNHLDRLSKAGIIMFDSTNENKPYSTYSLSSEYPEGQPSPHRQVQKMLTDQIYKLIKDNPQAKFTIHELVEEIIKRYPEYKEKNQRSFYKSASAVLSHLGREGLVIRGKFDTKNQSVISLSDTQRETLIDLVTIIDRFSELDEDYIKEGLRHAKEITSDPERVSALMEKARTASPNARKSNMSETAQHIKSIIGYKPSTAREIQQVLDENYGKKLTTTAIRQIVRSFSNEARLKVEKINNVNYYSIDTEKPEETVVFESPL